MPSESHIFKTVSQELCPSDGSSHHIAVDGRRSCDGARRCQAFSFCPGLATKGFLVAKHRSIEEQLLRRNVKRIQGGLVFKYQRLSYHSTLGSGVINKKKKHRAAGRQLSLKWRETLGPDHSGLEKCVFLHFILQTQGCKQRWVPVTGLVYEIIKDTLDRVTKTPGRKRSRVFFRL